MKSTQSKKNLILTIELKNRELAGKCLLALFCLRKNMRIFIGTIHATKMLNNHIKQPIFFHKSGLSRWEKPLKEELDAQIVFLDEEAGFAVPDAAFEDFCKRRYMRLRTYNYSHMFVLNKQYESEVRKYHPETEMKIHVSGWPRIDLWRPEFNNLFEEKVKKIISKYGKFVLYVSSLGGSSTKQLDTRIAKLKALGHQELVKITVERKEAFVEQVEMLKSISKLLPADVSILFRPHTSENIKDWKLVFKDFKNIVVNQEGDVTPWITASVAVLQRNSTVGVQSRISGKPTLVYNSQNDVNLNGTIIYRLCEIFTTIESLYSRLNSILEKSNSIDYAKPIDEISDKIPNLEGEFASSKIATILDSIEVQKSSFDKITMRSKLLFEYRGLKTWVKNFVENVLFAIQSAFFSKRAYKTMQDKSQSFGKKVPGGIKSKEVRDLIASYSKCLNIEVEGLRVRRIGPNLVCVECE